MQFKLLTLRSDHLTNGLPLDDNTKWLADSNPLPPPSPPNYAVIHLGVDDSTTLLNVIAIYMTLIYRYSSKRGNIFMWIFRYSTGNALLFLIFEISLLIAWLF